MRIVTLNTWKNEGDYDRRVGLIAEGLAALHADVICLQECFSGGGVDTVASLARALGMSARAAPSRRKLRAHGSRRVMSTSGLAILTRGPVQRAELCALVSDPRDGQRIAQHIDVSTRDHPLRVLNLHLTHLRDARAAAIRAAQVSAALEWATAGWSGGLVVAGDLNATAFDSELALLALRPAPGTYHGPRIGTARSEGLAIDHCILQCPGDWRVQATQNALDRPDGEGWFPSDHAAVVLDLVADGHRGENRDA